MSTLIDLKNLGESISNIIGELSELNTTNKDSLINSINELKNNIDRLNFSASLEGTEDIVNIIEEVINHKNTNSSITERGHVKLNDTLTSLSDAEALTAAKGKILKDQIDTLNQQLTEYINTPAGLDSIAVQSEIDNNSNILNLLTTKHSHSNNNILDKITETNEKTSYDLSNMVTTTELETNTTTEKINTIIEKTMVMLPSSYPIGISIFCNYNTWSTDISGLENKYTIVQTNRTKTNYYSTQTAIIIENDTTFKILEVCKRASGELNGWGEWEKELNYKDLISTLTGKGASLIGINDVDGKFTSSNVEEALQEIVEIINSNIELLENKLSSTSESSGASLIGVGDVGNLLNSNNVESCLQQLHDSNNKQKTDLASTAVGEGASLIGIFDVGGIFDSSTVEGSLQELAINKVNKPINAGMNNVSIFDNDRNITDSGFTLSKSVPSDAVFTDTVYNHPSTHSASMINISDAGGIITATNVEDALQEITRNIESVAPLDTETSSYYIYVDLTNGNDNNSGLTDKLQIKTFDLAIKKLRGVSSARTKFLRITGANLPTTGASSCMSLSLEYIDKLVISPNDSLTKCWLHTITLTHCTDVWIHGMQLNCLRLRHSNDIEISHTHFYGGGNLFTRGGIYGAGACITCLESTLYLINAITVGTLTEAKVSGPITFLCLDNSSVFYSDTITGTVSSYLVHVYYGKRSEVSSSNSTLNLMKITYGAARIYKEMAPAANQEALY